MINHEHRYNVDTLYDGITHNDSPRLYISVLLKEPQRQTWNSYNTALTCLKNILIKLVRYLCRYKTVIFVNTINVRLVCRFCVVIRFFSTPATTANGLRERASISVINAVATVYESPQTSMVYSLMFVYCNDLNCKVVASTW